MAVKTHVVVVQNGKLLLVETKRAARELDKKKEVESLSQLLQRLR